MSEQDLDQRLARSLASLRDFEPGTAGFARTGRQVARISVERADLPVPTLVYLALRLHGCHDLGTHEKLAWEIPFQFRDVDCSIASEKFGLRLYIDSPDQTDSDQLARVIVGKLRATIRSLERAVLGDLADAQMAQGNVTIANQFPSLNNMYQFFRQAAAADYERGDHIPPSDGSISTIFGGLNQSIQHMHQGFYNTVAMIQAYFSRLEHTLVLLLPFSGYDPEDDSLKGFIGGRWAQKFTRIFPLSDPTAKRLYDRLHNVSEEYRNTYSHGGFDHGGAALHFQISRIGLVPAALSDVRDKPHFRFVPIERENFQQVCDLFDGVDNWMRADGAQDGMQWIEGGLDVRFDEDFRDELRGALSSDESIDGLIEYHGYHQDRAANMDW